MRDNVKDLVKLVAKNLEVPGPVVEIGSLQVEGQVEYADLRPFFSGKVYIGCDMRSGIGVDRIENVEQLTFGDDSVGTLLMVDTLEHVENCHLALKEIHRVLRPGGFVLLISVMDFPVHEHPSDYWRFTPQSFKLLLKDFAPKWVFFQGNPLFPHTVIGLGIKEGERSALPKGIDELIEGMRLEAVPLTNSGYDEGSLTEQYPVHQLHEAYRLLSEKNRELALLRRSLSGGRPNIAVTGVKPSSQDQTAHSKKSIRDSALGLSAPARARFKYDFEVDLSIEDSSHTKIVKLVGNSKNVLEFGCATGYMSKVLVRDFGCTVTGVELDPGAAAEAQAVCKRVIIGDAETLDYVGELGEERFDVIIFGDVLEHLKHPGQLLEKMRNFLSPNGFVLASIPNIAHASVALELLSGRFEYSPLGLLDDTHLRFFTKKSLYQMFEESGFLIHILARVIVQPEATEFRSNLASYPYEVLKFVEGNPEATTYQFIVKAYPATEQGIIAQLQGIIVQQEDELAQVRAQLEDQLAQVRAQLEDQLAQVHAAQAEAQGQANQLNEIYDSMSWKFIERSRKLKEAIFPAASRRRKFYELVLKMVKKRAKRVER